MPADASKRAGAQVIKLWLNIGYEIWQVYDVCAGRSSDFLRNLSKREGKKSAALY